MLRSGIAYYFDIDGLGSINLVNETAGTVQDKYLFDAWGAIESQTAAVSNPFGYTSREFGEAGTFSYRARYYIPSVGKFVNEDPIRWRGGINWYTYVFNNPVNFIDPNGLEVTPADVGRWMLEVEQQAEAWSNTLQDVSDFFTESGDPYRLYGPDTVEAWNMRRSKGVAEIRNQFVNRGCKNISGRYGSGDAFAETIRNGILTNSTQAQFGSYEYQVINNDDGTATFILDNQINLKSLLLHLPVGTPERGGLIDSMGNLDQRVVWTEKCGCP